MTDADPRSTADGTPDPWQRAADTKAAARATVATLTSRIVIALLGWAGTVVIARSLDPGSWGQFSFVFALLSLMAVFTDLGVGRIVLSRLIDDDPEEVALTASSFVALRAVLGLFGYLIAVGYVVALGYPGSTIAATSIAGLVVVFATPGHALTVLYQSRHRLAFPSVAETLGQTVQLALTVLTALTAPKLLLFVLAPVAKEALALALKIFGIRGKGRQLRLSSRIDTRRWGNMLREAVPLAIGFGLTMVMLKLNVVLLSLMEGFEAVGFYAIGTKFSDVMDTLSVAATGPVSMLLVAAWPREPEVFRRRTRSAAALFTLAGAVVVAAFWPSAERITALLYGERFTASASAARFQVLGSAMMALIGLGIYLLAAAGKQRHYLIAAFPGLIITVLSSLALIPRMSFTGAAIATTLSLGATAVVLWAVIMRVMPVAGLLPLRCMASVAATAAATTWIGVQLVGRLPWPVVSAATGLVVLSAGFVLYTRDNRSRADSGGTVE